MSKINKTYLKNYILDIKNKNDLSIKEGDVLNYLDIFIKDSFGNTVTKEILKENINSYLLKSEIFSKLIILGNNFDKRIYDKYYKKLKIERELNFNYLKNIGLNLHSINEKYYGIEYVYEFDLVKRTTINGITKINNNKYKIYLRNYIFILNNNNNEIEYLTNVKNYKII